MTTINLGRVVGQDGADGEDGRGIVSIEKTGTQGLVDTYTITYTDGTTSTFEVTNGQSGGGGSSNYNELSNKPSINNVTLQGNKTLSDLGAQAEIDSSHKLSADNVDDASTTNKFVTSAEKSTWNGKQNALVSGTNIKTINNESILGSGNITIQGGDSLLTEETITVGGDVPVTGLELDYTSLSLEEGQEQRLACTVLPTNATDTRITWASSNTNVATVVDGLVTGISQGNATVTVTSVSNPSIKINCTVTVTGDTPIEPTGIDVSPSTLSGQVGSTGSLTATITPSGATGTIVWSSGDTSVATVSNGTVTYVGAGNTTITATIDGTQLSDTCDVTVTAPTPATKVYLQDLTPVSTGKILNKNGTELAVANAAYWEVPYTEGMFASTLYNDGWIDNYPPIMIKNGTTLTKVTTTKIDYPAAGQSQYTATLTGYDANVSVIIQADYYSSASRREYLYYDTEGGE